MILSRIFIAASVSAVRCGASKKTIVRSSAASDASRRARSPALRGRNPSKQNRSLASPEMASAVVTAEGPASAVTRTPASTASRVSRYPGSDTPGMPASVITSTVCPPSSTSSSSRARAASLAS